jgi:hypothetical protein
MRRKSSPPETPSERLVRGFRFDSGPSESIDHGGEIESVFT